MRDGSRTWRDEHIGRVGGVREGGINSDNRREATFSAVDLPLGAGEAIYSHDRLTAIILNIVEITARLASIK